MAQIFTSESRFAEVGIFTATSAAESHVWVELEVDEGMVVVGGGIRASENPGKLIAASFPRADFRVWRVR